jgi:hypothetical protein
MAHCGVVSFLHPLAFTAGEVLSYGKARDSVLALFPAYYGRFSSRIRIATMKALYCTSVAFVIRELQ